MALLTLPAIRATFSFYSRCVKKRIDILARNGGRIHQHSPAHACLITFQNELEAISRQAVPTKIRRRFPDQTPTIRLGRLLAAIQFRARTRIQRARTLPLRLPRYCKSRPFLFFWFSGLRSVNGCEHSGPRCKGLMLRVISCSCFLLRPIAATCRCPSCYLHSLQ